MNDMTKTLNDFNAMTQAELAAALAAELARTVRGRKFLAIATLEGDPLLAKAAAKALKDCET